MSPFKKTSKGKYKSPSGRKYTGKQVKLYHARNGFPKGKSRRRK